MEVHCGPWAKYRELRPCEILRGFGKDRRDGSAFPPEPRHNFWIIVITTGGFFYY